MVSLGQGQYHLAVAGGCMRSLPIDIERVYDVPTRYREVVLTVSKQELRGIQV